MQKKQTYTLEELDELKNWFESHEGIIPEDMQIDNSAYTPNLKNTINALIEQAYIYYENPKMQGSVRLLEKIRMKLENNPSR